MQAVVDVISRRVVDAVLPAAVSKPLLSFQELPPLLQIAPAATGETNEPAGPALLAGLAAPTPQRVPAWQTVTQARAPRRVETPVGQGGTITAGRTTFARCSLTDLQPGDVAFQFLPAHRNFRQFWIAVGGHISNFWRPWNHGDASVLHAFVVTGVDPPRRAIYGVDAAGGDLEDISEVELNFATRARVVEGAQYFFYRPTDPGMAKYMVTTAYNWASPGLHNFSIAHAVRGPFQSMRATQNTWDRALFFLHNADIRAPLFYPNTCTLYKMMCSEFVANVCQTATLLRWRELHPQYSDDGSQLLRGLYDGPTGDAFAVNAAGVTPPLLHRRMEDCPGMQPVGWVNDQGE